MRQVLPSCTSDRGQTEPIAALVAVSAVALALSFYGVAVVQVLDQDTQRDVQERALDAVWEDIRDGGAYDENAPLEDRIDPTRSLPRGYTTRIEVRMFDDGERVTVSEAGFAANRSWVDSFADAPAESQTATRNIPVRTAPGEIETGILVVEVWEQ